MQKRGIQMSKREGEEISKCSNKYAKNDGGGKWRKNLKTLKMVE